MLALQENDGEDALSFSFADDIVELVILTADETFLQTLRDAVGNARRLWHVPSSENVGDLLIAGQVGILVMDVQALHEEASVFVSHIKHQFPDLVIVAAGGRDADISLANLISAGLVYRFIHKPMSPARAKLFADAAVRKHDERRRQLTAPSATMPSAAKRRLIAGAASGGLAMVIVAVWAFLQEGSHSLADRAPPPTAAAGAAIAAPAPVHDATAGHELLNAQPAKARGIPKSTAGAHADHDRLTEILSLAAERMLEHQLIEPERDNARWYVQQALLIDPNDSAAEEAEQSLALALLSAAHAAIEHHDLAAAASLIEAADGIASPANVENLQRLLRRAEAQAESQAPNPAGE